MIILLNIYIEYNYRLHLDGLYECITKFEYESSILVISSER